MTAAPRWLVKMLALTGLALSLVVMSSAPADAVESGIGCAQGELVGNRCVITGDAPVRGEPRCPTSPTVIEDATGCYSLSEPTRICAAGAALVGNWCVLLIDPEPGDTRCPANYVGSEHGEDLFCFATPTGCPDGATFSNASIECHQPADLEIVCPSPFTLTEGLCLHYVDPYCPQPGEYIGAGVCEAIDVGLQDECPEGYGRHSGICSADPTCPRDTQQLYTECYYVAQHLEVCTTQLVSDGVCIEVVDAECPEPGIYMGAGVCEAEPIETPASCPAEAREVLDEFGGVVACKVRRPVSLLCSSGALINGVCRTQVPLVPGPLFCVADGFGVVNGTCVKYLSPTVLCDGHEVTINMRAGDSGVGTDGDDVILGTGGSDFIVGNGGNDVICAGRGNDIVFAGSGADVVYGEQGNDRISGGDDADAIFGGSGNDVIAGNAGADLLDGEDGSDRLYGQGGRDMLIGASGFDRCTGGGGIDISDGTCERRRSVS